MQEYVSAIANDTARTLGLNMTVSPEEILISDESSREGNGILTQEISDAIRLTAIKEGILLDPVYTGKAMAGLIDLTRKGYFKNDDGMVFLHTGGTPALFVYKEELLELMKKR